MHPQPSFTHCQLRAHPLQEALNSGDTDNLYPLQRTAWALTASHAYWACAMRSSCSPLQFPPVLRTRLLLHPGTAPLPSSPPRPPAPPSPEQGNRPHSESSVHKGILRRRVSEMRLRDGTVTPPFPWRVADRVRGEDLVTRVLYVPKGQC